MKEFVEKLIERLEKHVAYNEKMLEMFPNMGEVEKTIYNTQKNSCEETIRIVNQLAEEYNQEHDDTDYANIELYAFWQKHQWIPCSEKKPRMIDAVLVCKKDGFMTVAIRGQAGKFCDTYANVLDDVVAWMPLPEPFKPISE